MYDEAKKQGWTIFQRKKDWKRIFAFTPKSNEEPVISDEVRQADLADD